MTQRRRDFTRKREPIEFTVDDDVFRAPATLPAPVLLGLLSLQDQLDDITKIQPDEALKLLGEIFDLILMPDSADRFKQRLASRDEPIDLADQVMPIVTWLVEEYTARPTRPSSPSATSPNSDGTTSTDGQPPTVSTPSTLTQTVS